MTAVQWVSSSVDRRACWSVGRRAAAKAESRVCWTAALRDVTRVGQWGRTTAGSWAVKMAGCWVGHWAAGWADQTGQQKAEYWVCRTVAVMAVPSVGLMADRWADHWADRSVLNWVAKWAYCWAERKAGDSAEQWDAQRVGLWVCWTADQTGGWRAAG